MGKVWRALRASKVARKEGDADLSASGRHTTGSFWWWLVLKLFIFCAKNCVQSLTACAMAAKQGDLYSGWLFINNLDGCFKGFFAAFESF